MANDTEDRPLVELWAVVNEHGDVLRTTPTPDQANAFAHRDLVVYDKDRDGYVPKDASDHLDDGPPLLRRVVRLREV